MANIVINKTAFLDAPITVDSLHGMTFTNESGAHQFVISAMQGGNPLALTGSVSARFMRANNTTILLTGSVTNGKAVITLHQDCYNVPGRFQLAIFNTVSGTTTCIYAAIGTVQRTVAGELIDSGEAVPDISDLLAQIDACEQATAAANAAATKAVRYDSAQTLTETQKAQARANIDGASMRTENAVFSVTTTAISEATTTGRFVNSTGGTSSNSASSTTDFFAVTPGAVVTLDNVYIKDQRCVCGYNRASSSGFVSVIATDGSDSVQSLTFTVPAGVTYIMATSSSSVATVTGTMTVYSNSIENAMNTAVSANTAAQSALSLATDASETIDAVKYGTKFEEDDFIAGSINSNGNYSSAQANDNYVSLMVAKKDFNSIYVSCDNGYQFAICNYNGDTFVNRQGFYNNSHGVITIDNTYGIRIDLATVGAGTGKTITEMLEHFHFEVDADDIPSVRALVENKITAAQLSEKLDWVYKIMAGETSGRMIHFSFDDVWIPLYKLQSETPSSVWDVTEFAQLKTLHEATGACITLNVFLTCSEQPSYNLASVPGTWASEFAAAKDWLKFAFHAASDTANYSTLTTGAADYNSFVSAIHTITGDYDCIDRVTRLGFFGGTATQILAMKGCNYGPVGFLTQDRTGYISYYLTANQCAFIDNHGKYYDHDNEVVFIRTLKRLDNISGEQAIEFIEEYAGVGDKYIEIFSHLTGTDAQITAKIGKMNTVCTWANNHGFTNGFPYKNFS
jgi:hypothetical protein